MSKTIGLKNRFERLENELSFLVNETFENIKDLTDKISDRTEEHIYFEEHSTNFDDDLDFEFFRMIGSTNIEFEEFDFEINYYKGKLDCIHIVGIDSFEY